MRFERNRSRPGRCGFRDPDLRKREGEGGQVHIRFFRGDLPERFLHFADVGGLFQDDGSVQEQFHGRRQFFGVFPDQDSVFASLQDPGGLPFVV